MEVMAVSSTALSRSGFEPGLSEGGPKPARSLLTPAPAPTPTPTAPAPLLRCCWNGEKRRASTKATPATAGVQSAAYVAASVSEALPSAATASATQLSQSTPALSARRSSLAKASLYLGCT